MHFAAALFATRHASKPTAICFALLCFLHSRRPSWRDQIVAICYTSPKGQIVFQIGSMRLRNFPAPSESFCTQPALAVCA